MSEALGIPSISKDKIKELMFDVIGFQSREEKVKLGIASMDSMDSFSANGLQIVVDTTDNSTVDKEALLHKIINWCKGKK